MTCCWGVYCFIADASSDGLGAVFIEEKDDDVFPVTYHNRKLKQAEKKL